MKIEPFLVLEQVTFSLMKSQRHTPTQIPVSIFPSGMKLYTMYFVTHLYSLRISLQEYSPFKEKIGQIKIMKLILFRVLEKEEACYYDSKLILKLSVENIENQIN